MEDALRRISVKTLKTLAPDIHGELMEFCSDLDKHEYPEATVIANGKGNMLPLLAIYQRMNEKDRKARKHLKKAENLILSMNTLTHGHRTPKETRQRDASCMFPNAATEMGQDIGRRLHVQRDEELKGRISDKIKRGLIIGTNEVLAFAAAGYSSFLEKTKNANPLRQQQPEATVIMCSDARQPIGEVTLDGDIEVLQIAGNSFSGLKPKGKIVIFVGHGGPRCGAVAEAEKAVKNGKKPTDPNIAAITVDSISRESVISANPEMENAIQQAKLARKAGYNAYAIYADLGEKTVMQVFGDKNGLVSRTVDSVGRAIAHAGDLGKQTAGFAILTRAGRAFPGKTILDVGLNLVFETNFDIDNRRIVGLPTKSVGSLTYALGHITGEKDSKNILVIDPDPKVALAAAELARKQFPEANVICVQEDWVTQQLRLLRQTG